MEIIPFKQVYTLSIVMIGSFNPKIIQPYWFSSKNLIREQEAQEANVELIHPELVRWNIGWMNVEVTNSRFEIRSSQEPYFEPIKDLVISILGILKETPIAAIGFNHLFYFALPDEKRYYDFGNNIVPLAKWGNILKDPKLFQVELGEVKDKNEGPGQYRIRIQPSDIKLTTPYGVLIHINDHFDVTEPKGNTNTVIEIINQNWTKSSSRALNSCMLIGNI